MNRLRCEILNTCLESGSKPKGVYTLTVPTGGGKTVASLAFALRHVVAHGMRRVVYVIPYTSRYSGTFWGMATYWSTTPT